MLCISRNFYTTHIAPRALPSPNGIATSRFSTSKNGTHHCWLQLEAKGGGGGEDHAFGSGLPAVAYACVREPDLLHGLETGSAHIYANRPSLSSLSFIGFTHP